MPTIPIESKSQLRPRDVVRDLVALATGQVVSLEPQGTWDDGSRNERICVEWLSGRYRSDPRVDELVQVVHYCRRCSQRIVQHSLIHGRWLHDGPGDFDHLPLS